MKNRGNVSPNPLPQGEGKLKASDAWLLMLPLLWLLLCF